MEIQVTANPHMLLETVELLYAYINDIPPEELTAPREHCLPVEAVQEIMAVACAGISRDDPQFQYYFAGHLLPGDADNSTCIARNLVYMATSQSSASLEDDCAGMKTHWEREMDETYNIATVGKFYLWFEPKESPLSLLDSISALNMDGDYTRKLREQLCDYGAALDRLKDLIAPTAQKLELLLRPWVMQAEKRAGQWKRVLSAPDSGEWFMRLLRFENQERIDQIRIQLRYLDPLNAPGVIVRTNSDQWDAQFSYVFTHIGLGYYPDALRDTELFDEWEFRAMRLLGSPVRLRMLHALWDNPMSSRELAKALNLNLGTLCRDMNSLYECKLLILETTEERKRYRTNRETMEYLAKHLTQFGNLQLAYV